MRVLLWTLILSVSTLLFAGCGEPKVTKTVVALEDIPAEIMAVAKKNLPDVTFRSAMKKSNGAFEIQGKTKNGKVREIDIKPDGTVEEIE